MSLGDDLLDAIAAAPDDPTPRLVYADHRFGLSPDDPHAELIVVQERLAELEATRLWRDWFTDEIQRLRAREQELIAALELTLDVPSHLLRWSRGFVEALTMTPAAPSNLARRIHHPFLRLVRTLRFQDGASVDLSPVARDLPPIRRLVVPAVAALDILAQFPELTHLEIRESPFDVDPQVMQEAALGYSDARRRMEHEAEAHGIAEQERLAEILPKLPAVRELVLATSRPLEPRVYAALSAYPGWGQLRLLRFHAGADGAAALASRTGNASRNTNFEAAPDLDTEQRIRTESAIGAIYLAHGRAREAFEHLDDAFCLAEGRYPGLYERWEEAARAAGVTRKVTEPDPARDGLIHRVPGLMRWQQWERIVAVAPNHRGAWAQLGIHRREHFDLDGAAAAFAHALEGEEDVAALSKAHALFVEDPPAALGILNGVRPSVEANVLFAAIHALQSNPEVAIGLLRGEAAPTARLLSSLCERQRGNSAAGRETWRDLSSLRKDTSASEEWVIGFFAALLCANDPYALRRAFHTWFAKTGPHRPRAFLVIDPIIRLATTVVPQVDVSMVSREVDHVRGA